MQYFRDARAVELSQIGVFLLHLVQPLVFTEHLRGLLIRLRVSCQCIYQVQRILDMDTPPIRRGFPVTHFDRVPVLNGLVQILASEYAVAQVDDLAERNVG